MEEGEGDPSMEDIIMSMREHLLSAAPELDQLGCGFYYPPCEAASSEVGGGGGLRGGEVGDSTEPDPIQQQQGTTSHMLQALHTHGPLYVDTQSNDQLQLHTLTQDQVGASSL